MLLSAPEAQCTVTLHGHTAVMMLLACTRVSNAAEHGCTIPKLDSGLDNTCKIPSTFCASLPSSTRFSISCTYSAFFFLACKYQVLKVSASFSSLALSRCHICTEQYMLVIAAAAHLRTHQWQRHQGHRQQNLRLSWGHQSCEKVLPPSSGHVLAQVSKLAQRCPEMLNVVSKSQACVFGTTSTKFLLARSLMDTCMPRTNCHGDISVVWVQPARQSTSEEDAYPGKTTLGNV